MGALGWVAGDGQRPRARLGGIRGRWINVGVAVVKAGGRGGGGARPQRHNKRSSTGGLGGYREK
jgi:hypothetical protein